MEAMRIYERSPRSETGRPPLTIGFARAVARLRAERGYSEEQLAARAGLHPAQLARIEGGEAPVPLATVERLAGALGIRVSELLYEAERDR